MSFTEDVAKLSERVRKNAPNVLGEEATKQALILPFFSTLGYDVWDTTEVIPEYISDAAQKHLANSGRKKSGQFEKVDYAIAINERIVMLVEAKSRDQKPEIHDGQLAKYFTWTLPAKVGIVSNGTEYRFFTDLQVQNIMDVEPFFIFNVLDYSSKDVENLKLFHRDNFDASAITGHAEEMVYVQGMTKLAGSILRTPSEEFIKFLIVEVGKAVPACQVKGNINKTKIEKFRPIVKKALQNGLVDLMTRSITQEMEPQGEISEPIGLNEPEDVEQEQDQAIEQSENRVVTTDEEKEAFEIVKKIASTSTTCQHEVGFKDVESYFGLHVGKPGWWFMRLYLSPKKKSLVARLPISEATSLANGFEVQEVSTSLGGDSSRVVLASVKDLDALKPLILKCYEMEASKHPVSKKTA